jgi:hypothetical protein
VHHTLAPPPSPFIRYTQITMCPSRRQHRRRDNIPPDADGARPVFLLGDRHTSRSHRQSPSVPLHMQDTLLIPCRHRVEFTSAPQLSGMSSDQDSTAASARIGQGCGRPARAPRHCRTSVRQAAGNRPDVCTGQAGGTACVCSPAMYAFAARIYVIGDELCMHDVFVAQQSIARCIGVYSLPYGCTRRGDQVW